MNSLLIASSNRHKVDEIQTILGPAIRCFSLQDLPEKPSLREEQSTFDGNALQKASDLALWLQSHPTLFPSPPAILADDSGLEVRTLAWAPGVYSARFAALDSNQTGNSSDAENNAKLLRLLASTPESLRQAQFRCVLALLAPTPSHPIPRFFTGICTGRIALQPSGANGFGYDPLFIPDGYTQSFAELGDSIKNRISHRSRALAQLQAALPTL